MTLKEILYPSEQEIRDFINEKQSGHNPKKFILDRTYWSNDNNRFQLIGNDYTIKENLKGSYEINGWDPSKLIIRIDYKDNVLKLSEIFLTQPRTGTGTLLIKLLIKICEANNISKFKVLDTNEKSASLCEKLGLIKEENSNNYFIYI